MPTVYPPALGADASILDKLDKNLTTVPSRADLSRDILRCAPADLAKTSRLGYLAYPEAPEFIITLGLLQGATPQWQRRVAIHGPRALEQVPLAAITAFVVHNQRNVDLARRLYRMFEKSGAKARAFLMPLMYEKLPSPRLRHSSRWISSKSITEIRLPEKLKALETIEHPTLHETTVVIYSNRDEDFLRSLIINRRMPWRTIYTVNVHRKTLEEAALLTNDRTTILVGGTLVERLHLAMQAVETPYVFWMGDDDFVNPRFLVRARQQFDHVPGVGSIVGSGRNVAVGQNDARPNQCMLGINDMGFATVLAQDPVGRLREVSVWSSIYFHNLLRSDVARTAAQAGQRHNVPELFLEILMDFAIVVCGPMSYVPVLSVIRRRNAASNSFSTDPFLQQELEREDTPLRSVYRAALEVVETLGLSVPTTEVAYFISNYVVRNFTTNRKSSVPWNRRPSDLLIKAVIPHDEIDLQQADRYVLETYATVLAAGELGILRSVMDDGQVPSMSEQRMGSAGHIGTVD
jgi:hypothetical protein